MLYCIYIFEVKLSDGRTTANAMIRRQIQNKCT